MLEISQSAFQPDFATSLYMSAPVALLAVCVIAISASWRTLAHIAAAITIVALLLAIGGNVHAQTKSHSHHHGFLKISSDVSGNTVAAYRSDLAGN
ncbi:MAG TPA: hypothetical protein VHN11_06395 [Xanthobacteraceae bacterium]|jgi:hypothetical protein|nr:hypothetical protein [Xanthobacteraceae bacterium]